MPYYIRDPKRDHNFDNHPSGGLSGTQKTRRKTPNPNSLGFLGLAFYYSIMSPNSLGFRVFWFISCLGGAGSASQLDLGFCKSAPWYNGSVAFWSFLVFDFGL